MLWKVEGEPKRTLMHGPTTGISVLINPMLHEYFLTDYAASGITVRRNVFWNYLKYYTEENN